MELKEIFRHDERRLYPEVMQVQSRYNKLLSLFVQFIKFFPPSAAGVFPKEMQFHSDSAKPVLHVRYCGMTFSFCFDMVKDKGQVRCFVFSDSAISDDEPEELGRFTFNGQGFTNISPGGHDADLLQINEGGAAYGIVASFLVAHF